MNFHKKNRLPIEAYVDGILSGNKMLLSRAITLIESKLPQDDEIANEILNQIIKKTGNSVRIGITGVPGVGKSTFINVFGQEVIKNAKKLAVLAVDPTSTHSGGSIMGDKTRMDELSQHQDVFIRPSPTGKTLGGVATKTREAMLLCEAAGYEVIIIETVGVGQSETVVREMTDFFLLLILAGGGDELQGIKRGIMENTDAVVITKKDELELAMLNRAIAEYRNALHFMPVAPSGWSPQVATCSAMSGEGIAQVWEMIEDYVVVTSENGFFQEQRNTQDLMWMRSLIKQALEAHFSGKPGILENQLRLEKDVLSGAIPPRRAAQELLNLYFKE